MFFKKATIMVAFLFSIISSATTTKVETYKDVIEKAYNLSLQKDRGQAVSILVNAAKRETKKGTPPIELINALDEVAKVFYSEKAQQQFEVAMSLKQADTKAFLAKLNEVDKIEPNNLTVQLEILRNKISNNNCGEALAEANVLFEKIYFLEEVALILAQASVCEGKQTTFDKVIPSDRKKTQFSLNWELLLAQVYHKIKNPEKMELALEEAKKINPEYPEIFYWSHHLGLSKKDNTKKSAERYMSSCKKLTTRQYREFTQDPFLCRQLTEVENYLKKNNNLNQ